LETESQPSAVERLRLRRCQSQRWEDLPDLEVELAGRADLAGLPFRYASLPSHAIALGADLAFRPVVAWVSATDELLHISRLQGSWVPLGQPFVPPFQHLVSDVSITATYDVVTVSWVETGLPAIDVTGPRFDHVPNILRVAGWGYEWSSASAPVNLDPLLPVEFVRVAPGVRCSWVEAGHFFELE